MINQYDLYDMTFAFIKIRENIKDELNSEILSKIIYVLSNESTIGDNQIRKWLKNPHSDSAEYKMWGNGVALPNVVFVLSGIVYYSQFSTE